MNLVKGKKYQFIGQSEEIIYIGKDGNWNQFEKFDDRGKVWCELLDSDLHLIEEGRV